MPARKDDVYIGRRLAIHTSQPYMQSKKRTPGPPVTLNKEFNEYYERSPEQEHDFVLLGSQDKFSKNVKYKISTSSIVRDSSPPKQMKFEQRFQKENKVSRAKDVSPAPVVNTDKYKKPLSTPLAPRQEKSHTDVAFKEMKQSNVAAKEPKMAKEVPREPKYSKEPKVSKTTSGQVHQSASEVRESKARRDEAKNLDRADPVKNSMKTKSIGQTNAFAQTSMEQGIARSAPEASADYAFKYKTGMTAPRPSKKQTEYQKQFPWRENFRPASPLLKAEQELLGPNEPRIRRRRAKREVVYNSNPQLVPPRKSTVNKLTEYQKQFREYKLIPADEDVQVSSNKKRSKLQRSKSMEDLAPAEIQAAGIRRVVASCNKRLILSSDQVQGEEKYAQPVEVPRRKQRQVHSEYDSNFRSPTKFDYVRGSWQGAAPPQIQMKKADEPVKSPVLVNWFAEVIELRRKAQEYRKRAQGTHFSREHLAQLMAQQNTMWETSTQAESATARSYLSALSLESGLNTHTKPRHTSNNDNARNRQYREADSTAATMATDDDCSTTRLSECDEVPQGKKLAWGENDKGRETPSTFTEDGCSDDEGGVIIPRKLEPKRRHHFDRTTPNQEGAVLASSANAKKRQSGKRMVNKSVDSISLGEEATPREYSTPVHRPLAGQATYTAHKGAINTSPTFGMPSRDTHLLRDDGYYADQELRTKYVVTPARSTPGGLGAIEEGYGQTYSKSNRIDHWAGTQEPCNDIDDDVLSVSMQSIASSCSLASATLERARKRKDDFWGPKGVRAK